MLFFQELGPHGKNGKCAVFRVPVENVVENVHAPMTYVLEFQNKLRLA